MPGPATAREELQSARGNPCYLPAGAPSSGASAGLGPTRSTDTRLITTGVTGISSLAGTLAIAFTTGRSSHWPKIVCRSFR